jgi:hypothetical protein
MGEVGAGQMPTLPCTLEPINIIPHMLVRRGPRGLGAGTTRSAEHSLLDLLENPRQLGAVADWLL